jgi:hypothetical protein
MMCCPACLAKGKLFCAYFKYGVFIKLIYSSAAAIDYHFLIKIKTLFLKNDSVFF